MTLRYDYICSLGSSCLCASSLREAGLRLSSGPFDWMLGPSLLGRVQTIASDFRGWLEPADLECLGDPNNFNHDSYLNRRTGYKFSHDFERGVPLEQALVPVREKYARRIARFYAAVRASRRVLFVWLENPMFDDRPSSDDVVQCRRLLAEKFPGVEIDLLIVDRAADNEASGKIVRDEGVWRVSCGYRTHEDRRGEARPWDIDTHPILDVLSRFSVTDSRSSAERRRRRAQERAAKRAVYGAHGLLGYVVSRVQTKVCKFLLNGLRRRGANLRVLFDAQMMEGGR